MPLWYDIGLNLTHDSFDPDRDQVLAAARAEGVAGFAITGADAAGSERAARMAGELGGWSDAAGGEGTARMAEEPGGRPDAAGGEGTARMAEEPGSRPDAADSEGTARMAEEPGGRPDAADGGGELGAEGGPGGGLGFRACSTAGVHPHHAKDWDEGTRGCIRDLLDLPQVAAVGEAGLDYFRNFSPREDQLRCFEAQIALAAEAGMPLFAHQRDAHADLLPRLREAMPDLPAAVVHCFTGTAEELDDYLGLGAHVGITGWICDERRGLHLRELVGRIPADRLMLETDAPYLAPRDLPGRPRRNEPRWLPHIGGVVAACRGEAPEVTARNAWRTSLRFFGLPGAVP